MNVGEAKEFLDSAAQASEMNDGQLSLKDLMDSITALSTESGLNSQSRKLDIIFDLYRRSASSTEIKFILRCLHPSGLRIGLSNQSMEKSLLQYLQESGNQSLVQDFEKNIFGYRISSDSGSSLLMNVPLKPMVGRPVKNAKEAVSTLQKKKKGEEEKKSDLIVEVKYDGERTQIHFENGKVNLFSRNFDSQNKRFWLLKQRLELFFESKVLDFQMNKTKIDDFILDGEIVYVDSQGNFMEFQEIERKFEANQKVDESLK